MAEAAVEDEGEDEVPGGDIMYAEEVEAEVGADTLVNPPLDTLSKLRLPLMATSSWRLYR